MKLPQEIAKQCAITLQSYTAIAGGDSTRTLQLYDGTKYYFLKICTHTHPQFFEQEAAGLVALRNSKQIHTPNVLQVGVCGEAQFLLLEWIEPTEPSLRFWEAAGRSLAALHQPAQLYFGWEQDNFISILPQQNQQHTSWSSFYINCRLQPLIQTLYDRRVFNGQDVSNSELLFQRVEHLFPIEQPSLLHGDLWNGNLLCGPKQQAVFIDPSVYYGHREMDLGMTLLFGGFHQRFYEAYEQANPLSNNWRERLPYTQLYPLLVHSFLFGGTYIQWVKRILKGESSNA
jgi:fructosamine-3-kinase